MSYFDYIKQSNISDEEWDFLLSQSSKKFLQDVLKSQISNNRFFGNELLLKLLYSYIFDMGTSFITHDFLEIGSVIDYFSRGGMIVFYVIVFIHVRMDIITKLEMKNS